MVHESVVMMAVAEADGRHREPAAFVPASGSGFAPASTRAGLLCAIRSFGGLDECVQVATLDPAYSDEDVLNRQNDT